MPRIDLEVVVHAEIGIAPTEIGRQQVLHVRVSADVDPDATSKACQTADIHQTLDYGDCRRIVRQIFEARRFKLLEEPAQLIKQQIAELVHVKAVTVSIAKQHPWPDVPSVCLTL